MPQENQNKEEADLAFNIKKLKEENAGLKKQNDELSAKLAESEKKIEDAEDAFNDY